jgi:hypothetical protein
MRRTPEDHLQRGRFLEPAVTALGAAGFDAARRVGAGLSVTEALDLVTALPLAVSEANPAGPPGAGATRTSV